MQVLPKYYPSITQAHPSCLTLANAWVGYGKSERRVRLNNKERLRVDASPFLILFFDVDDVEGIGGNVQGNTVGVGG